MTKIFPPHPWSLRLLTWSGLFSTAGFEWVRDVFLNRDNLLLFLSQFYTTLEWIHLAYLCMRRSESSHKPSAFIYVIAKIVFSVQNRFNWWGKNSLFLFHFLFCKIRFSVHNQSKHSYTLRTNFIGNPEIYF